MKKSIWFVIVLLSAVLMLTSGCVETGNVKKESSAKTRKIVSVKKSELALGGAKQSDETSALSVPVRKSEPALGAKQSEEAPVVIDTGEAPKTLAIFPFENNSVTDPQTFTPLCKGLAAMLITDLSKAGSSLKVIERENIKALIEEMALSESGVVDESTAVRLGKLLGAQSIAFGSFIVMGNQVRIDARIIKVETGELVMADAIMGSSDNFMGLVNDLARKLAASLKVAFHAAKPGTQSSLDAALFFCKGLDAFDRGNKTEAELLFRKCLEIDPAYQTQVENIQGINNQ
jgi:TolB-like protein